MSENTNKTISDAERAARRAKYKKKSELAVVWRQFKKNKLALFGLFVIVIMVILALGAPLFIDLKRTLSSRMS